MTDGGGTREARVTMDGGGVAMDVRRAAVAMDVDGAGRPEPYLRAGDPH